ncbi:MAG TPA: hypothetical protein DDY39_00490 [Nitrospira sp.]|nr:hypothetical protein [Nitrospira sp.]HBR51883.1 hypothetical protein [Nitrospira sp.]
MRTVAAIIPLVLLISIGCTSSQGFNRTAMSERLHGTPAPNTDVRLPSHQSARPSPPFRLGIFFVKHQVPDTPSIRKVAWLSADRDQLLRELAPLRDEQLLADMFVLTDVRLRGADIKEIRQAGARFGADMVLIVDGVAGIDRYNNRYAWLYPTLLGAYLAPGTKSDVLIMATGSLRAVRSDWHAPLQTTEAQSKTVGAAAFLEDNTPLQDAKKLAIQTLGKSIVEQLRLLK